MTGVLFQNVSGSCDRSRQKQERLVEGIEDKPDDTVVLPGPERVELNPYRVTLLD